MNYCTSCRRDFVSVEAFDQHRVGDYIDTGPAEYLDRVKAGLVNISEIWQPSFGRRCLDEDEIIHLGWRQNARGQWSPAAKTTSRDVARAVL